MQKFTYDNTQAQRGEVILYAFHPDIIDASIDDIRDFLTLLSKYMPTTTNVFGRQPNFECPIATSWRISYDNVLSILKEKQNVKSQNHTHFLTRVSILILFFGVVTSNWLAYHKSSTVLECLDISQLNVVPDHPSPYPTDLHKLQGNMKQDKIKSKP